MIRLHNKTPKILVVGDLMVDHYIWGSCTRISPEAPVQVVNVTSENNRLGGACNVGANLSALGAEVSVCGVIGDDSAGKWLLSELETLRIDTSFILQTTRPTTQKSRILIGHQQVLRVDREKADSITSELESSLLTALQARIESFDAVIISDYAKGLLTPTFTQSIITLSNAHKKPILVDPKGSDYSKYKNATLLTPNKLEASLATQVKITDDTSLKRAMEVMQEQCNLSICLVTLSEDGIAILQDDTLIKSPTIAKEVYDVTGAGDTVIAALAFGLSNGLSILQASDFANAAAAVVIGKIGSAVASLSEIISFLHNGAYADSKIISQADLQALLPALKDKRIIFTNGCFDILHAGHISYLQKARELGDLLIVGLNSDDSITRLKGPTRPIITQDDRAAVLAGLECVDFVVIFTQDTPLELVRLIRPSVLVKGADYEGKEVVGAEYAKKVELIAFKEGKSTSAIIRKISEQHATAPQK